MYLKAAHASRMEKKIIVTVIPAVEADEYIKWLSVGITLYLFELISSIPGSKH